MPSGKTHTQMTTAAAAVTLAAGHPVIAAGCAAGWLLSPDLDVDAGYYSLQVIRTLAGDVAASAWRWYWRPYALAIPHRSVLSHLPVVSTAVRMAYLALPWLVYMLATGNAPDAQAAVSGGWDFFVGLALADTIHAVADVIVTAIRRTL